MDTTQIFNFISNNYGALTLIGGSIVGLIKTRIFPAIREFLQEKNSAIKDEKTKSLVTDAEERVKNLLIESMSATETTTKEEIVKKIELGELNKDSLKDLLPTVVTKVKNQLSDTYKNALVTESGSLEDYLTTKAQYFYDKMKADNSSIIGTIKVSDVANIINKSADALTSSDITALQTQLQQSQTDKEGISQQLAQSQKDKETVLQQLSQTQAQLQNITQRNSDLQANINNMTASNTDLNNQLSQSQSQVQSLTQQVSDLNAKITSITSALSGVNAITNVNIQDSNVAQAPQV
jgi:prefoldin subunit 5